MWTDDEEEDHPCEASDVSAEIQSLAARVAALERRARVSAGEEVAHLDEMDVETGRLVADLVLGEQVKGELLSDMRRRELHATVQYAERLAEERDRHLREALEASKVLASTLMWESTHAEAADSFRASSSKLHATNGRAAELTEGAEQARNLLNIDDAQRRAAAAKVRRGDEARIHLHLLLGARISDAFERALVMPTWFNTALGAPPAEDTQRWTDVAAEVLTFRLTYGVTDPILALGRSELSEQPEHRHGQFQILYRRLGELRR